jgi:hypothetical protein
VRLRQPDGIPLAHLEAPVLYKLFQDSAKIPVLLGRKSELPRQGLRFHRLVGPLGNEREDAISEVGHGVFQAEGPA